MSAGALLGLAALGLLLGALLAASEAALAQLGRRRLLQLGGSAAALRRLLERPHELERSLFLGGAIAKGVSVAAATVFAERAGVAIGVPAGLPALLEVAVMAALVLVVAEFLPRLWVAAAPEGWGRAAIPVLWASHALLGPVARLGAGAAPRAAVEAVAEGPAADEPATLVAAPGIEPRERAMLQGAFRLRTAPVRELMTPLARLVMAEADTPVAELIALVRANWHARVPVHEGPRESVRGMLYAKDLLPFTLGGDAELPARALMREASFVPPTKTAEELLRDFQREHVHVAVVVDEYGKALGLLTLQDVIKQIVGEVKDEFDIEEPAVRRLEDGSLLARGEAPMADVQQLLGVELGGEAGDSVESFLLRLRPQGLAPGEEVLVEGRARFRIERTAGHRIWMVRAAREERLP